MMLRNLLIFIIFVGYFCGSEACSCMHYDDYEKRSPAIYCSADWVADVYVLDVRKYDDTLFETSINYTQVYKMPPQFNETYPTKVYTHQQSSACGFKLPKGGPFMLVGYVTKFEFHGPVGTIDLNSCSILDTPFEEKLRNGTQIECPKSGKEN